MALKHSVTADEFTALPEAQQGLYQQAGDSYTLDVEDDPRRVRADREGGRLPRQQQGAGCEA